MKKPFWVVCCLLVCFSPFIANSDSALGAEPLTLEGEPDAKRIVTLRNSIDSYGQDDIEFMVRVVFADVMNSDSWLNNWVRKSHIPSLTHLAIQPRAMKSDPVSFTVLRLPEQEGYHIVIYRGYQGSPQIRRWMAVEALVAYFRKFTTGQGEIRTFEAGFLGLKGLRMGMELKWLQDELHEKGLMRTRDGLAISKKEVITSADIPSTLSR